VNHGSLFSGIGGFDLAAEWMGWDNIFHCEWMPFPRKVLNHYWPNSISYEDITKTDFTIHRGTIDILTGGFPCQPYSSAGKRLGKEDERHLWPHMLRVISEVKPTYVVGENVRGLTNWNGGVVFEEVCADLESQGYTVQPILLPACAVGAPHRRDRVWFIAANTNNASAEYSIQTRRNMSTSEANSRDATYSNNTRDTSLQCGLDGDGQKESIQWEYPQSKPCGLRNKRNATNSDSLRQHERKCNNEEQPSERRFNALNDINENDGSGNATNTNSSDHKTWTQREVLEQSNRQASNGFINVECTNQWENFPTQSPICGGDDGLPPKLDGITFSKWRQESIKGYGNAIVPQVAYEIFKVIAEMDAREKTQLKLF
jgi:DNA (cytosine-5)-methyltransferase 1